MELLNEKERRYSPEDINWCIGEWSEEEKRIIEENMVGYSNDGKVLIADIPDGEYLFVHWAYVYSFEPTLTTSTDADKWTSKSKICIKDGAVDIQSVKIAVAEVLNQCEGWHVRVESLFLENGGKVSAFLGS